MIETFKNRRMDILGVQETHMRGSGILECKADSECGVWEGMEGGVVWSGIKEGSRGRGKERCGILLSKRMWEGLEVLMKGDEDNMG